MPSQITTLSLAKGIVRVVLTSCIELRTARFGQFRRAVSASFGAQVQRNQVVVEAPSTTTSRVEDVSSVG